MENDVKDTKNQENVQDEEINTSDVQSEENPVSKKKKIYDIFMELMLYVIIIVVCVTIVPKYVMQRTIVDGPSMENTLQDLENVMVEKVSYRFKDPERFDIIVFYPLGRDHEEYYIKRVIGLPGETVQIKGETIYINGEPLEENYGKEPIVEAGIAADPITLGDDEFFVLGDNRTVSEDSRYTKVGPVKRENIEGKAVLRVYPFSEFGLID